MASLTDTQVIVLSRAAARDDGVPSRPPKMSKARAAKIGAALVERKLMREVPAKPGAPVWSVDEEGRALAIVITARGRKAIDVQHEVNPLPPSDIGEKVSSRRMGAGESAPTCEGSSASEGAKQKADHADSGSTVNPRVGSKQALIVSMLRADAGASIGMIANATGWLPHTTRAALTGLRKRGFSIERSREDGGESSYRIVTHSAAVPRSPKRPGAAATELAASA